MADDFQTRLTHGLQGRYTIERELGGGGMSRVFLGTETALGRRVVIKVLHDHLAASLSARRFEREIRLAASLQQANIVPVLASGTAEDFPYFVMPFVEGLSLRESLAREGPPGVARAVAILRDVARALAFAHDRGVVHRDIKPDNVLLSGDAAVVTDFGIAKAVSAASSSAGTPAAMTLTETGLSLGTPAYMAPEQIAADPRVDFRADLYAFGCLAYEVLTGEPPFTSPSPQALFADHLVTTPVVVSERCPECPPPLARLVMQCLEKSPAERPSSARDLLEVLEAAPTPATGLQQILHSVAHRPRASALVGLAALTVVTAGLLMRRDEPARVTPLPAIAVVPFLNLGADSTHEYVADGLADGLATALGKLPGVRIVSRALSYRYKGQRSLDSREVGEALAAGFLVHGAVRDAVGRLTVSVQLTSTSDNSELWAETFAGSAGDLLAVEDSVTRAVAAVLTARLGTPALPSDRAGTTDPEAHDLYLRGRFLLLRRGPGVRLAVANLEEAIARDPAFARAHAGLALALQLLPYFEPVRASEVHERSMASVQAALRGDSALAEAHVALAMAHQHAFRWEEAEAAYRRALTFQADEPDVHIQFGRFLFYTGQLEAAMTQFELARQVDPYSAVASGWLGMMRLASGREAEGMAELQRALEIDSMNPPSLAFAVRAMQSAGRSGEARRLANRLWDGIPGWRPVAAATLAELGEPERAVGLVRDLLAADPPPPLLHTRLAHLYLALGDSAAGLASLERAAEAAEILPTYFTLLDSSFDPIRQSPRFAAVVRRYGLDEAVFTASEARR